MAIVIANGILATFDVADRVIKGGAVRIEHGAVSVVGRGEDLRIAPEDRVIDASGCLVVPGFTNAHTHSPEIWARGRTEALALEPWLTAVWPALDTLSPRFIRTAILIGAAEMLKTGTTAVVDHFRQTPMRMEAIAAAVAAYREVGMRAAIAVMLRDKPVPKDPADRNGERQSLPDAREIARLCEEAIGRWHDPRAGTTLMLGPSAPHRCTDQLLAEIARISSQRDMSVHMHVDETHRDRDSAYALYKKSSIQHLREVGLLGPRLSVAHAVWVDDADMDLLSDSGSVVVHNPVSNARLGSGLAPVADLHRRGITVALGTDGAASNDSQNVLEALKCAALTDALRAGMARDSGREETPIKARELAAMATRAGGRVFGGQHGMLTPGAAADIAVLEIEEPLLQPVENIYRQLVYAGARLRSRHVLVGGRLVVENGCITTIDEANLYSEAQEMVREIYP